MNTTAPLAKQGLQTGKTAVTTHFFREFKFDMVKVSDHVRPIGIKKNFDPCTDQLSTFFTCLKQRNHDNIACSEFEIDYQRCIAKNNAIKKNKAAAETDVLGTSVNDSISSAQLTKILKRHPQPKFRNGLNLGNVSLKLNVPGKFRRGEDMYR